MRATLISIPLAALVISSAFAQSNLEVSEAFRPCRGHEKFLMGIGANGHKQATKTWEAGYEHCAAIEKELIKRHKDKVAADPTSDNVRAPRKMTDDDSKKFSAKLRP